MADPDGSSTREDAGRREAAVDAAEARDSTGGGADDGAAGDGSDAPHATSDAAFFDASDASDSAPKPPDAAVVDVADANGAVRDARADAISTSDATSTSDTAEEPNPNGSTELAFVLTYLGGVWGFTVNTVTGVPTPVPGSPFDRGVEFYAMAVLPSGKFAYAVDSRTEGALHAYRIDPDGSLHAIGAGAALPLGPRFSIAADPAGQRLYASDASLPEIEVFDINPATGALSARPSIQTGALTSYMTTSNDGQFLYLAQIAGIRAFATPTAGDFIEVMGSPFGRDVVQLAGAMVAHPGGKFVYSAGTVLNGFEITAGTGALRLLDGSPVTTHAASDRTAINVALDSGGHHLYTTDSVTRTLSAFAIEASSGALTPLVSPPYDGGSAPYSVAVDPSGRFVWVGEDSPDLVTVFSRDVTSGQLEKLPDITVAPATGLQPEIVFAPYPAR